MNDHIMSTNHIKVWKLFVNEDIFSNNESQYACNECESLHKKLLCKFQHNDIIPLYFI